MKCAALLVTLLLLSTLPASAAIAFVTSSTGGCTASATSCTSSAVTIASGNTIVVIYAIATTTSVGSAPTLTGNTFTLVNGCALNNSTSVRIECWATTVNGSVSVSSKTLTCNVSPTSKLACAFAAYSGASLIGTVATATSSSASPTSPSITTQDANDWCVAGYAGSSTGTFTISTGNLRGVGEVFTSGPGTAITDNVVVGAGGACTTKVTNTDTVWALASIELRTASTAVASGNGTDRAPASDQGAGLGAHLAASTDRSPARDLGSDLGAHLGAGNESIAVSDSTSTLRSVPRAVSENTSFSETKTALGAHLAAGTD